ncbi:MAG: cytochrome b561 [Rouxiella aceris]|uniref:cytochrome b561 n=1 Tax=Rouxiella aceris TaxID=2703884 RepID=UPI002844DC80|nr:cytochrome b561 [Rouxiella aceris]MDR3431578.1 cytochrome b561 [Rouxiella aceris]
MRTKFTPIQIAIHWTVFLIVAATYATIELKGFVPKTLPLHQLLTLLHFSFGFCVLALMFLRVFVRLMYVTPGIVPKPPQWQHLLAQLTHLIIYMMFISIPILGILSLYFKGMEWTLFSLKMPITIAPDLAFSRQLKSIHEFIANAGYYLIGLHAAAALFHHYIAHDNTLLRMMPGGKSAGGNNH